MPQGNAGLLGRCGEWWCFLFHSNTMWPLRDRYSLSHLSPYLPGAFGTPCAFPAAMKLRIPILLAFAAVAFAQDEPAPLKLTLHDAVGLALKQNPQVILANLGVAQSEQDRLDGALRTAAAGQRQRRGDASTASTWRPPSASASRVFRSTSGPSRYSRPASASTRRSST